MIMLTNDNFLTLGNRCMTIAESVKHFLTEYWQLYVTVSTCFIRIRVFLFIINIIYVSRWP